MQKRVAVDVEKARYILLGACSYGRGCNSTFNLALSIELNATDLGISRAIKHWMIGAAAGHDDSLNPIRDTFLMQGHATKHDYEKALRGHKEAQKESEE